MLIELIRLLLLSLGFTLGIELFVSVCYGIRNKKELLLIALVNVITNPIAVLLYYWWVVITATNNILIQIPLEFMIIVVEAKLFKKYAIQIRKPVSFSVLINLISFSIGIVMHLMFG